MISSLMSRVLVLDDIQAHGDSLKFFYDDCGLIGIRPQHSDKASVVALLKSNIDLGGIMLYENFGGAGNGIALAREIRASRPELPIFLRRDTVASCAGLAEKDAALFRCAYVVDDLQPLRAWLEASIFSRVYPNELVRGIAEMTQAALANLFRDCDIDMETPYLVKDRIIYGEVFTLIAIESHWCRGYMMLQAGEEAMLARLRNNAEGEAVTFRDMNNVLGEATNLVWGAFKNRYGGAGNAAAGILQTQVPIVINHHRGYISFGSDDPQLCLKYTLRERNAAGMPPLTIYQRFVFNLNWSPDDFSATPSVESLVNAGELELF